MKLQAMTAHELREAAQGLREFAELGHEERYVDEYKRGDSTIPAHLKMYRISLDNQIQLFREIAQLEERAIFLDAIESYEAENRTRNAGQAPDERTESALSARVFVSKIKSLP